LRCPSFKGSPAKLGINLVCCTPASRKQSEIIVIHNCDIVRLNAFFSVENLLGSTQDFTDGHPERSGGPGLVNRPGKSTRVLFFFGVGNTAVVTKAFVKKTQRTPPQEIVRAQMYRDDYQRRHAR